MEAIILAGGFGTRLRQVVPDIPKPMAPVNGRPFLEYLLDQLINTGVTRVILATGHLHQVVSDHFGKHYRNLPLDYSVENEPLGTGGAIRLAFWKTEGDRALILNGDSYLGADFRLMYGKHMQNGAEVTLAVRKVKNANRFGLLELNRQNRITGFREKSKEPLAGWINGGVYFIEKRFLMAPDFRGKFSLEKDCFERYYNENRFFGFRTNGYFIDIGVPEDYRRAQGDFARFES